MKTNSLVNVVRKFQKQNRKISGAVQSSPNFEILCFKVLSLDSVTYHYWSNQSSLWAGSASCLYPPSGMRSGAGTLVENLACMDGRENDKFFCIEVSFAKGLIDLISSFSIWIANRRFALFCMIKVSLFAGLFLAMFINFPFARDGATELNLQLTDAKFQKYIESLKNKSLMRLSPTGAVVFDPASSNVTGLQFVFTSEGSVESGIFLRSSDATVWQLVAFEKSVKKIAINRVATCGEHISVFLLPRNSVFAVSIKSNASGQINSSKLAEKENILDNNVFSFPVAGFAKLNPTLDPTRLCVAAIANQMAVENKQMETGR